MLKSRIRILFKKQTHLVIFGLMIFCVSLISCKPVQEDLAPTSSDLLSVLQEAGLEAVRGTTDREQMIGRTEELIFYIPSQSWNENYIAVFSSPQGQKLWQDAMSQHAWYLYTSETVSLRIDPDIDRSVADSYGRALGLDYISP